MSASKSELAARRRVRGIIRKASLYTWTFTAAAVVLPLAGTALIAWLLTFGGLPFLDTWIALSIIVYLPSLIGMVWKTVRGRNRGAGTNTQ